MSSPSARIVVIGGGPAGYEAALVAAQLGAEVTVVERDGVGGACVLYDCVPSKTFIATSGATTAVRESRTLGVRLHRTASEPAALRDADFDIGVDADVVYSRVRGLALAQSADIKHRLEREGVQLLSGTARFADERTGLARHRVLVSGAEGESTLDADVVLIATGASPRIVPGAQPDGARILTWRQVYDLDELPHHLVVIGSGVTGAEFASAYTEMGVPVTLISSRDRVLPGEDAEAAAVLETVFAARGTTIVKGARAVSVTKVGDGVEVVLDDGRVVTGSHALMTVGSVPNTEDLGLDTAGIALGRGGFVETDRVSRTNVPGVYAAGDCTGVLMLASVAAMQGRIAMWHALGEAVSPLKLKTVSANVFTHPEIATVGLSPKDVESGSTPGRVVTLPLATNARAKMEGLREGFVKLICRPTGVIVGGVVVAPSASELIMPITMAVQNSLTVENLAQTFTVYPSMSGSIAEAGRQLMAHGDLD